MSSKETDHDVREIITIIGTAKNVVITCIDEKGNVTDYNRSTFRMVKI